MKKALIILALLAVSAVVVTSVGKNNPIAPNLQPEQGKLMFALEAANNIASGTVTISKESITHVLPITISNHTGSVTSGKIQVGKWHILVELFDNKGAKIYEGQGEADIKKDQTTTVTIKVEELTGNLKIVVEVPKNIRGRILYRNFYNGLYLMDLDGSNREVLIPSSAISDFCTTEGCNYRGGSRLVFIGNHPSGEPYSGIYMANLAGTGIERLDLPPLQHPRWSWNGQKLAANTGDGINPANQVVTFNPDGSGLTILGQGYSPIWTPDNRIVYSTNNSIHVMNANGSGDTIILSGLSEAFISDCSPDLTILFDMSDSATNTHQQYSVKIDGSNLVKLTATSDFTVGGRFDDTGSRIAFQRGDYNEREIWIMNADGSGQRQLTFNNQLDEGPVFIFY